MKNTPVKGSETSVSTDQITILMGVLGRAVQRNRTNVRQIDVCVCSHSVVSNSLRPHGLQPARLLSLWNFPGKSTGGGCLSLLQGVSPTQEGSSGLSLLRWQVDSLPLVPPPKPRQIRRRTDIYHEVPGSSPG